MTFEGLSPSRLKKLGRRKISDVVLGELPRARARLTELERRYPSAGPGEKAQRLIDRKKAVASTLGGVTGALGLAALPAELLAMVWLQLTLLVDLATVYRVNLKSEQSRAELLDLFGHANGIGSARRASPRVLSKVATAVFERGGFEWLGRAVPLVASPISAYLNRQHIQAVGDAAIRFYKAKPQESQAHV